MCENSLSNNFNATAQLLHSIRTHESDTTEAKNSENAKGKSVSNKNVSFTRFNDIYLTTKY